MTEISVFIDEDEAPRFELPRLRMVHLLGWMAATAAAFAPHQLQEHVFSRYSKIFTTIPPTAMETARMAASAMATGSLLFVAIAVLVWKRRGNRARLEPGHHFAFQVAVAWFVDIGIWTFAWALQERLQGYPWSYWWFSLPQQALPFIFFFWFLALAFWAGDPPSWRWAYAALAAGPLAGYVINATSIISPAGFGRSAEIVSLGTSQDASLAIQLSAITAAATIDWRRGQRRHWSHTMAVVSKVVLLAVGIVYYTWLMLNPPY